MKKRPRSLPLLFLVLLGLPASLSASLWMETELKCPLCGATNRFMTVVAFGDYIFQWPSKYQDIYWPYTEEYPLYSCCRCRLTCFMFDFADLPKWKHDEVNQALKNRPLPIKSAGRIILIAEAGKPLVTDLSHECRYLGIPMTRRLEAAEEIYRVLDRDDWWWCWFHRVKAYHYHKAAMKTKAVESRRAALAAALRLYQDRSNRGRRSEILYVSGAMRFLLDDFEGAREDFRRAQVLLDPEKDRRLSLLLDDYVQFLHFKQAERELQTIILAALKDDDGLDDLERLLPDNEDVLLLHQIAVEERRNSAAWRADRVRLPDVLYTPGLLKRTFTRIRRQAANRRFDWTAAVLEKATRTPFDYTDSPLISVPCTDPVMHFRSGDFTAKVLLGEVLYLRGRFVLFGRARLLDVTSKVTKGSIRPPRLAAAKP